MELKNKKLYQKYSIQQPEVEPASLELSKGEQEFLDKVNELIEANIADNNFNVQLLADKMHISRSLLFKRFSEITDMSIGEHIRIFRLKMAAQLLQEQKHSIIEIALMVGFTDRPQFTRSFSKLYGLTPKQFEQKSKNK